VTRIAAIAALTVREALRQKLAVNLLVFALVVIGASIVLSELTFGEQYRIIADLAFTAAAIFGTLIAVFLGAGLVAGDVQRKTVYPILAKPVSRAQYVIGRFAGLTATLTLNLAVMAVTTVAVLRAYRGDLGFLRTAPVLAAFAALAVQLAMVAAIAVLFSTFANATLSAVAGLSLAAAGHLARNAIPLWLETPGGVVAAYVIPNLAALDLKLQVVYEQPVPAGPLALTLGYGLCYAGACVALAAAIFSRRNLV
jgi:ABC-type transport system involved in multi-copper enzyme maturation permease subunit